MSYEDIPDDLDLAAASDALDSGGAGIITCSIEGVLEASDIAALAGGALDGPSTGGHIQQAAAARAEPRKLREKHHQVARLMATGMAQGLIAQIVNYDEAYLSTLVGSPSMQELIGFYRLQHGNAAEVIGERLRTVGASALERLADRIDSDELDANQLIAAAKLGLDRSGHGPVSSQHIRTDQHIIDHAKIEELHQNALGNSKPFVRPRALPAPSTDSEAAAA